jgi:hypothetical protein
MDSDELAMSLLSVVGNRATDNDYCQAVELYNYMDDITPEYSTDPNRWATARLYAIKYFLGPKDLVNGSDVVLPIDEYLELWGKHEHTRIFICLIRDGYVFGKKMPQ